MAVPPRNILAAEYTLRCQSCGAKRIIEQASSSGLRIGLKLEHSPAEPSYGRCLRCQRYDLVVIGAPPVPEPLPPKGFSKIPTE